MDLDREPAADEALGMAWWNGLTVVERANWLQRAGTSVVAEAWAFFKQQHDDTDDDDRTLDSSFWFDEFTIPQYDYLVARAASRKRRRTNTESCAPTWACPWISAS
jgi:hypothetical protein